MHYEYYSILAISREATPDEIKKAYRKKAMECHPDRHAGDKAKEAEFKKVNEAYSVLSDPEKKSHYDRHGTMDGHGAMGGGFSGFWGFEDIFESFFSGGQGRSRRSHDIGDDIEITLSASLTDAIRGSSRTVDFSRRSSCESCRGTGAHEGKSMKSCTGCHGAGQVRKRVQTLFGMMEQAVTCPECHGRGQIITEKCHDCHGSGVIETKIQKDIEIPAGIEHGMSIKIRGEGHMGRDGNGDLYITFQIPDREAGLTREWSHLHYDIRISPAEAVLGTEKTLDIPILGRKKISIKAGTPHGEEIIFRGEWVESIQRKGHHGNLILHIVIDIPHKLSSEEKRLYEALLECSGGKKMEAGWLTKIFWG